VVDLGVSNAMNPIKLKYADEICISNYEMSPLALSSRICFSYEELWNIL
jgi:rRNA pseudouridine-1189 N-methylase Emg1 (Nep1/Mra1 family)